jgi:serine protease Do
LAEQFGVKVHGGVLVAGVQSDTPAAKAGLKSGDVIVKFAGKPVADPQELQGLVEQCKIGSSQELTVMRDGHEMALRVTVREQPANAENAGGMNEGSANKPETSRFDKLGIQAENLTADVAQQLGIEAGEGVVITDVRSGSPADLAGLSTGMVITQVDRQPVKTVDDMQKLLAKQPLEKGVLLLVRTEQGSRYIVIRVEKE